MSTNFTSELVAVVGYRLGDHSVLASIERVLGYASSEADRLATCWDVAMYAVPVSIEPIALGPPDDPLPPSSPTLVSLHWLGLFHTTNFGPTLGGTVLGRSYALDLNLESCPVYAATDDGDGPTGLEGYVMLDDSRAEALEVVERRWKEVAESELDGPQGAKRRALERAFVDDYPGVARHLQLGRRLKIAERELPEPRAVPRALMRAFEAGRILAPALLEVGGLPARGSAPETGSAAYEATLEAPELPEHEEPLARVGAIAAWLSGDEERLVRARARLLACARQPISHRWYHRLEGWTRKLHVTREDAFVGGTAEGVKGDDGFVLIGAFDVARAWGGCAGWLIVQAHASDIGVARARFEPSFDPTSLTRRWAAAEREAEASWIPAAPWLGSLGAKLGGRPGWLQDAPRDDLSSAAHLTLLAQLDCEMDALYESQRGMLCDGALYVFGHLDAEGRPTELRVEWQY